MSRTAYPIDFDNFRKDFAKAMESLEAKYDVSIKLGNVKYGEDYFHGTLQAVKADDNLDWLHKQFRLQVPSLKQDVVFKDYHLKPMIDYDGRVVMLIGYHGKRKLQYMFARLDELNNPNPIGFYTHASVLPGYIFAKFGPKATLANCPIYKATALANKINFKVEDWMHVSVHEGYLVVHVWDTREVVYMSQDDAEIKACLDLQYKYIVNDNRKKLSFEAYTQEHF